MARCGIEDLAVRNVFVMSHRHTTGFWDLGATEALPVAVKSVQWREEQSYEVECRKIPQDVRDARLYRFWSQVGSFIG